MPAILGCLKDEKKFKIEDFMESLQIHRRNVVDASLIWTGFKYIDLQYLDELTWSRVFHEAHGLCFTYDL